MVYTLIQAFEATGEDKYLDIAKSASGDFVDEKVFLTDTAHDNLAYPLRASKYLNSKTDVIREPEVEVKDYTSIPRFIIVTIGLIWLVSLVYRKFKK